MKVKLIRDNERGFPITSLREINIVMQINHDNIVKMKEIVTGDNLDKIYLVMEYCQHELRDLIEHTKYDFKEAEIKCIMM